MTASKILLIIAGVLLAIAGVLLLLSGSRDIRKIIRKHKKED